MNPLRNQETDMKNKPQPVHQIRLGAVKAAIWENQNAGKTWHNVTFSRSYQDGEQWKSTDSFGRDDLPVLMKVADQAHTWLFTRHQPDQEPRLDGSRSAGWFSELTGTFFYSPTNNAAGTRPGRALGHRPREKCLGSLVPDFFAARSASAPVTPSPIVRLVKAA